MRILLAEDSAPSAYVLRKAVESLGHECVVAVDGLAAWDAFQRVDPEVVISDWLMPGIDGDELCRRIRRDPDAPYSYFIMLTGLEDKGHVLEGMEAGADDYLIKPFALQELLARVRALARRRPALTPRASPRSTSACASSRRRSRARSRAPRASRPACCPTSRRRSPASRSPGPAFRPPTSGATASTTPSTPTADSSSGSPTSPATRSARRSS